MPRPEIRAPRGEGDAGAAQRTVADDGEVDELDLAGDPVDGDLEFFVDVSAVAYGDDQPVLRAVRVDPGGGEQGAVGLVDAGGPDTGVALELLLLQPRLVGVGPEDVAEVVELGLDRAVELVQLLFGLAVQAEPGGHRVVPSVSGSWSSNSSRWVSHSLAVRTCQPSSV